MIIDILNNDINSKDAIYSLCERYGPDIKAPFIDDKVSFLFALSGKETGFGLRNRPRYEPTYGPNGLYYQRSKLLQMLYIKYGALISSSYGPWQILACTAYENQKYTNHPLTLWDGNESAPVVVGYLNYLIKVGAKTIEDLVGAYNAGPGCLTHLRLMPKGYIKDFLAFYDLVLKTKKPKVQV